MRGPAATAMSVDQGEVARTQVANSVRRYASAHRRYERKHPEIFNEVEQGRLRRELAGALELTPSRPQVALDLGVGSGNVTAHLVALDAHVTAADVSPHFLEQARKRFGDRIETFELNGLDLDGIADESFDLVTAYSVLHHIPDYLAVLDEIARVLRPGGVVYLDHEVNEEFWRPDGCVVAMREAVRVHDLERPGLWNPARRSWQRFLMPSKYVLWLRLKRDPAYLFGSEGDIHVWAHDHIEWPHIEARLKGSGLEIAAVRDYLNFSADYPVEVWRRFRDDGCTDMRTLVAKRPLQA